MIDTALAGYQRSQDESADRKLHGLYGFSFVQALCAPVGLAQHFRAHDFMCASVSKSNRTGQDSFDPIALFNVRPSGTVYLLGLPCNQSPVSGNCAQNYATMINKQRGFTPTTKAEPTSCGPYTVTSPTEEGAPKHFTRVTVTGASCATARAAAASAVQPIGTASAPDAADGWSCSYPPGGGSHYAVCDNTDGPGRVNLYVVAG